MRPFQLQMLCAGALSLGLAFPANAQTFEDLFNDNIVH
jgi:hypothetical protein